jgi:hypothetical protein
MTSDRSFGKTRRYDVPHTRRRRPGPGELPAGSEDWSALQQSVGNSRLAENPAGPDWPRLLRDPGVTQTLQSSVGNTAVGHLLAQSPLVRGADDEDARGQAYAVSQETQARIEAQRESGIPLPAATDKKAAGLPAHGLGGVRVHHGAEAAALARTVHAEAFTSGRDVFLGGGASVATRGTEVLAHELTHVLHQAPSGPGAGLQRLPEGGEKAGGESTPEETFYRAKALYEAGKYSDAKSLFVEVRSTSSEERVQRDCFYDEAMCSMKLRNYSDAILLFNVYLGFAGADQKRAEEKLMEAGRAGIGIKDETTEGAGARPAGEGAKGERKNPSLQMGSTGPDVQYLQVLLNDALKDRLPESLAPDGMYGVKTATAVGLLQWSSAVAKIDGICGPETWDLLKTMYAQKKIEVEKKPA